ncbi:hypothetical protein ACFXO2_12645 [Streptomyces sp. NPDC059152]|uniref:hypothetical protein n=1 Tax=Streptomyces sp. NPDC059152 TaxID=3346742 RepID=UPI0036AD179C
MTRGLSPFLRDSTYSGALFTSRGAMASAPLLPLAALPALAWRSAPYEVRAALALLVWAAPVAAAGLARVTRRVLIASAHTLRPRCHALRVGTGAFVMQG